MDRIHLPAAIVLTVSIAGVMALAAAGHADKITAVAAGVGLIVASLMPKVYEK